MAPKGDLDDIDLNDGAVPPGPPTELEITDFDADRVSLKWISPLKDGGLEVNGYIVEHKDVKESDWRESDKIKAAKYPNTSVTDLVTGHKYEFRVFAMNRAGKGDPSESTPPQLVKSQKSPPKINRKAFGDEGRVQCKVNQQLVLEVEVDGAPPPETSWWRQDQEVKSEGILKVSHVPNMAKMILIPAKRSACGQYTLKAKNQHGEDEVSVEIEILGRPEIPSGPLEVSHVSKKTCTLQWKPSKDDGGAPITTYEIERMELTSEQWLPVGKTKGTTFEVKNLGEGKQYKFLVRAVNKHGDSPDLILDEAITAKDAFNPPSQPGVPELCDWGRDFADLRWNTPEDDGGAEIESYRIEIRNRDKRAWQVVGTSKESDTIINEAIKAESEYEFRVVAVNKAGDSEHSKPSKPMVAKDRYVKPKIQRTALGDKSLMAGQPLRLTADVVAEPPAKISWWSHSGAKYEDSDSIRIQEDLPNSSTLNLSSLRVADSGKIKVKAKNSEGSDELEISLTIIGPPEKPVGPLEVSLIHQTGCTLLWKKPESDGGSPIRSYTVERKNVESDNWLPCGAIAGKTASVLKELELPVKNLVEGEVYVFRVLASNAQGESEPLDCFVPVCPRPANPVPEKPAQPKIKAQDKKWVCLEWFVPPDADVKHYIIEKQEHFLVPKVEDPAEVGAEDGSVGDGEDENLKPRPVLKTGPSFTGEFQDYCSSWMVALVTDDNANSVKIADLGEGSKYHFRIKAVNGSGHSDPSDSTQEVTCKGKQRPVLDRKCFDPIKVSVGGNVVMQVKFTGDPVPERRWNFGKRSLQPSGTITLTDKDHLSRIQIHGVQRAHSGQYEFQAENEFGQETGLIDLIVMTEPSRPRGPMKIDNVHAEGCACAWLEPESDGGSPITHYIVERISTNASQWVPCGRSETTCCKIIGLPTGKEFRIQVKAINSEGESEALPGVDSFITENPFGTPGSPGRPEPIDADFDHVLVVWDPPRHDGGSRITGYELEARRWKDNVYFPAEEIRIMMERGEIKNLELNQVYAARVRALNAAGPGPWSMDSDVLVPKHKSLRPKVTLNEGKNLVLDSGSTLTLFAHIEAEPPAEDVEFELNGRSLMNDLNQGILIDIQPYKVKLQVDSVLRKMAGTLKCTARNIIGSHTAHLELSVHGLPSKPQGMLEVTNIHKKGCRLSWGKPDDNGGLPVEYQLERTPKNCLDWSKVLTTSNDICDVNDLEIGGEYLFRVFAVNSKGESEPLQSLRPVTAKDPISIPLPPGAPEIKDWSERHMELMWSPPLDDGGSPVTGYHVLARLNSSGDWQLWETIPGKECMATMQNLNPGTQYQFQVVAANKSGKSDPSIASRPKEARPQALAPTLNAVNMRNVKVNAGERVKFDVPFIGEPIPDVVWTKEGSEQPIASSRNQEITLATTETGSKLAFNNITRTQAGTYTVTIFNESGKDTASANIVVLDRPLPVEGLSALLGGSKCSLAWKRPLEDGGATINHYQIERFDSDKGSWMACGRSKETSFDAIGLLKGHEYRFRVSAVNRLGESDPVETKESFLIECDILP